jgi:hypothetical protein
MKPDVKAWITAQLATDVVCAENPIIDALGAREEVFDRLLKRIIADGAAEPVAKDKLEAQ